MCIELALFGVSRGASEMAFVFLFLFLVFPLVSFPQIWHVGTGLVLFYSELSSIVCMI